MSTTGFRTRRIILNGHAASWLLLSRRCSMPLSPAQIARRAPAAQSHRLTFDRRTMRVDYFHTGGPKSGETSRSTAWSTTDRGPAAGRSSSTAPISASTGSRSAISGEPAVALFARVRVDVRRMGDDRGSEDRASDVPRVAAVSLAEAAGHGRAEEAAGGQQRSRPLDTGRSILRRGSSTRRARRARRARLDACSRTVRRHQKVDLLVIGEGYTQAEMPKFHADVKRLVAALCSRKSRSRAGSGDFNVRALDLPSARERRQPAERRCVPPHAARRPNTTSSIPSATC